MEYSHLLPVVLAFSIIFLYSLILKYSSRVARKLNLPPQACGARPIIGHLHLLRGSSEPAHIVLGKMADQYGPIFTMKMGMKRTIVVSNSEMAKECLKTNDVIFAGRPKGLARETLGYDGAFFVFSRYDHYFRKIRRIVMTEALSSHRLETLKHIRESEVKAAIKGIFDRIRRRDGGGSNSKKDSGVVVEMEEWFEGINENVIFRMIVGKRFSEAGKILNSEKGDLILREKIRGYVKLLAAFAVSDTIPFLRWLDLFRVKREMKKMAKEVDVLLEGWLEEHKQKRKTNNSKSDSDDNEERDFMDVMISILDGDDNVTSTYDADTINKAVSLTIILGGIDTITGTLTWILTLLLNNREVLKKAQQELDQHVGRERQVKESDTENLVYLQAVIKETLRLYPPGPIPRPDHESTEDCVVGGYHIPAKTRLVINISKIQRDPKVWPDPNEFRPERFLTTHKSVDVRGQDFELIPFSSGRRICPGMYLALKSMPLLLASLLHGFELSTLGEEPVDMSEAGGLTNHKSGKVEVLLTPRLPARLYGH
ncbi:putative cytochrome P450 [Rosa chinensis]|uniref:Putative cytochrome P450 n=1 Tax=Rosa chinensis TaxID=74649 RepID=A0A2P6PG82_ROSCH|nr:cytochrome P450 CYP82D47 [Rosa chinensis]PRQ20942.1 putative cytochrome P450 [Rosa chinensis]